MLRHPGEEQYGETERLAVEEGLAFLKSSEADAKDLGTFMMSALDLARRSSAMRGAAEHNAELRVWEVLTVDIVNGRIQTVRIVRNPDKLDHL
jgi:RNA polymerase sigma-70 factor (ECF subfamily)